MKTMLALLSLLLLTTPAFAAAPSAEGIWLGTLDVGAVKLQIAFHVNRSAQGAYTSTMDSLSQSARGIPVDKTSFEAGTLRLELSKMSVTYEGKVSGDTLAGTFTQGKAFPLTLKRVASLEPPKRPQNPIKPYPYKEEEVSVTVPGRYDTKTQETVTLAGTLTIPQGKGPFPAVVFITGSGPEDRDETVFEHKPFLVLSDALTRAGVVTLRFDDRGTGKSTGTTKDLTTLDFAKDTAAELAWLAQRSEVDRKAIGLIGHSEGGLIAPIVATQSPIPTFLVLLAGTGMDGGGVLRLQIPAAMRAAGQSEAAIARARKNNDRIYPIIVREPDPKKLEAQIRTALADDPEALEETIHSLPSMNRWLRTFLSLDPIPYLKKVKVPVLALNGTLDLQVDVSNLALIERALKAGGNPNVTIAALPNLNHLFQHCKTGAVGEYATIEETMAPEAIAKVRDFIQARARR